MTLTQVGDVVYMHDWDTGASNKNVTRPCMIVAILGQTVRLAPRSASSRSAVYTAETLMPEFTSEGWFGRWSVVAARADVDTARNIGPLPEPERSSVLALHSRRGRRSSP